MRRFFTRTALPSLILGVLVLAATILFALYVDFAEVGRQLRDFDWRYMAAAVGALLACLGMYTWRWRLLLDNQPGYGHTFHVSNIGHAVNTVVPMRAGEVTRIGLMGSDHTTETGYTAAVSSYVVERMFEQVMRLTALGAAVFVGARPIFSPTDVIAVVAPLVIALLVLRWLFRRQDWVLRRLPPLLDRLPLLTADSVHDGLEGFFQNLNAVSSLQRLTAVFLLSVGTWFFGGMYHLLVIASMGDIFPVEQWLPVALAALAFSPPSATTQPIIFQAIITGPLAVAGFDQNSVFAYAVLLNISQAVVMNVLGLWGLTRIHLPFAELRKLLRQREQVQELVRRRANPDEEITEEIVEDLDE